MPGAIASILHLLQSKRYLTHVIVMVIMALGVVGSVVEVGPITPSTIISQRAAFNISDDSNDNEGVLSPDFAALARISLSSRGVDTAYAAALDESSVANPADEWEMRSYIVQSGDTISEIAERFGVSSDSVALSNGLDKNPDRLKIGQELLIPPASGIVYTVGDGDTISSLASRYDVAEDDIITANKLTEPYLIKPSQTLFIPGAKMAPSQLGVAVGDYLWPTYGAITTYFGEGGHKGLDVANYTGTPICASDGGTVITAVKLGNSYGWHVIIDHGNGITTLYGHLSRIDVDYGERVRRGQIIGLMGNTGYSTGPHLHFEVRLNGVYQNPLNYLP